MQMQQPHSWVIASYHAARDHVVVRVCGDELPDDDFQRRNDPSCPSDITGRVDLVGLTTTSFSGLSTTTCCPCGGIDRHPASWVLTDSDVLLRAAHKTGGRRQTAWVLLATFGDASRH